MRVLTTFSCLSEKVFDRLHHPQIHLNEGREVMTSHAQIRKLRQIA